MPKLFSVYLNDSFVGNYTCNSDQEAIAYIANRDFNGSIDGLTARSYGMTKFKVEYVTWNNTRKQVTVDAVNVDLAIEKAMRQDTSFDILASVEEIKEEN